MGRFEPERSAGGTSLLRRTLEETDWNVSQAVRRLDAARSHVDKLIGAFGLERRRG